MCLYVKDLSTTIENSMGKEAVVRQALASFLTIFSISLNSLLKHRLTGLNQSDGRNQCGKRKKK